jgi:hypothetical protein
LDEANVGGISSPGRMLCGRENVNGCVLSELDAVNEMPVMLGRRLMNASRNTDLDIVPSEFDKAIVVVE